MVAGSLFGECGAWSWALQRDGRTPRRAFPAEALLRDDLMDRLGSFDADQLLVEAVVEVGEPVRVEAHLLQDRGVEVLHVVAIGDGGAAEFVGSPTLTPPLMPPPASHMVKTVRVVIATGSLGVFGGRLASELASPNDDGFIEQAALGEIGQEPRDRLVGVARVLRMVGDDVGVGVPIVVVVGPPE